MKIAAYLAIALLLSVPALAWYDSTYEKVFERVSYSESERGHSSSSGYRHTNAYDDYSRTRSFNYEYDLERETINRGWDRSYRAYRSSSWRPFRPCSWNSRYISFGC